MHSYIAIQNNYHIFEMALFINNMQQDSIWQDKRHVSKLFIPLLNELLTRNNCFLSSLSFCVVNAGPGPFSTLRSIIASVNGLHSATSIPLISVDGLEATFIETYNPDYKYTVVLLNAFNNDVYYLIAHHDQTINKGYKKIDIILSDLKKEYPNEPINFVGNGVLLHRTLIQETLKDYAIISDPIIEFCSLATIAHLGLQAFQNNTYTNNYLIPLHLKKHAVEEL